MNDGEVTWHVHQTQVNKSTTDKTETEKFYKTKITHTQ